MNILVPVDGSKYSEAAVAFIASRTTLIGTDPTVELLNVQVPIPARAVRVCGTKMVREWYEEESDKVFKPLLRTLSAAGIEARSKYVVGHAGEEVGRVAAKDKADLIVMGSHGHSALRGLVMGSVTSAVLSHSTTPLLLVRTGAAPKADSLKVGIAVDGSKYGRAAVKFVAEHLSLFGAAPKITLVHVAPDFAGAVMPDMAGIALPAMSDEEIKAMQKQSFETATGPARKQLEKEGLEADAVCLVGQPADELSAYAKKAKLDVLVLGSHGYGSFKGAVMGSVATRVAAHCTTPLLLIRAT
jgi:nucleotide-binding universal stress UspA family protein